MQNSIVSHFLNIRQQTFTFALNGKCSNIHRCAHTCLFHIFRAKQNESGCFVFAAFCKLSIEGEREEDASPAVCFKGEVVRGGRGEPVEEEGSCVAIFLGQEQSVLYCTHSSKKSAKKFLLDNVLLLLAIISSSSSA